jgi:hypothetical protein
MTFYVYRLTFLPEGKHYIGSRGTKTSPSDDLGSVYKTSSKSVQQLLKSQPDQFKLKIVRVCPTRKAALEFEEAYQRRVRAARHPKFFNRAYANGEFDGSGPQSDTHKAAISRAHRGKRRTEEHRRNIALSKMGDKNPAKRPEVRAKCRAAKLGKPLTAEHREHKRLAAIRYWSNPVTRQERCASFRGLNG